MPTAVVYHEKSLAHNLGIGHPERPERLELTMRILGGILQKTNISILTPQIASKDDLLRVHSRDYIERIEAMSEIGGMLTMDTPLPKGTYEKALFSAGAAILAGKVVVEGEFTNSFALTRPPGHHAGRDFGGGFCFFNNIAVMITYLKEKHRMKNFLILDWDVHHGNGTQNIFYNDPSVLYFSTHQTPLYPGTGKANEIGAGEGEGYKVNFPLSIGTSGESFLYVLREVLVPLTEEFKPGMICISAGYDAYFADPLANLKFTIRTYAETTRMIKELAERICGGRIAVVLEGGYDLEGVSNGIATTISNLSGLDIVEEPHTPPDQDLDQYVKSEVTLLKNTLSKYWKCFR